MKSPVMFVFTRTKLPVLKGKSDVFQSNLMRSCINVRKLSACAHPAWRQRRSMALTPMMHLFSLFCCVRATCGFVCLARSSQLVASEARSCSFPFPLLETSLSLFHSQPLAPVGQRCLRLSRCRSLLFNFRAHAIALPCC